MSSISKSVMLRGGKQMKLVQIFSIIFSYIFLIQSSAVASGFTKSPEKQAVFVEIIKHLNSLSNEGKIKLYKDLTRNLSKEDRKAALDVIADAKDLVIPELEVKEDKVSFKYDNKNFWVSYVEGNKINFQGNIYDFSDGKWSESLNAIKKSFDPKTTSFMDFIIAPAYADLLDLGIVLGLGIVALVSLIAMGWFALGGAIASVAIAAGITGASALGMLGMIDYNENKIDMQALCTKFRGYVDSILASSSISEIQTAQISIKRSLDDLSFESKCSWINKNNCEMAKSCLSQLDKDLENSTKSHNGTRSTGKDVGNETSSKINSNKSGQSADQ